ncbi:hypothetical protein PIB30_080729 [Stylosanthes scabra]|uniref:Uncharacterized protein n=1 Tax=Stylosanthes scabra TaxID=79078 RepID=A0ABU6TR05_9FABA|nr:hypothetical protein [Stylosanthes scabra]
MARTTPVARYCRKPGRQPSGPHCHFGSRYVSTAQVIRLWNSQNRLADLSLNQFQKQNRLKPQPNRFAATFPQIKSLCSLMNRFYYPSNRLKTLGKLFQERINIRIDSEGLESIHMTINWPM